MSFDLEILDFEENAHQRSSTQQKIKNRNSYNGNLPGTLGIKVYYGAGCLNVHLGKAKLFGKRSQDPYARVYLFDEITQKCYFQRENKQTDVFNKNIEPNFNKTFYFKMDIHEIERKSIVVAIWDKDTKSKDDFMAGVRVGLQDVRIFEKREVTVNLLHQDKNGHPVLLTGNTEEKVETRAKHMAGQPLKIKGEPTFPMGHGILNFKMDYFWGFLHVHLERAGIKGNLSQDPFALVYLHNEATGFSTFQIDNNGTMTHDSNINPVFSHDFFFRMKGAEIQKRELVIAIWDDDSGKSHDDFMEGVCIKMGEFAYFEKLGKSVSVQLKCQEKNGHPARMTSQDVDSIFKIRKSEKKMNLETCNDQFLAFIERARVLSEATDIKLSLPKSLQEQTSVTLPNVERVLESEIMRLRNLMSQRKEVLYRAHTSLDTLKVENKQLTEEYLRSQKLFFEMEHNIFAFQNTNRKSVSVPARSHHEEVATLEALNLGKSMRQTQQMEMYISIKSEYEERIKKELNKARLFFKEKYALFIEELEKKANEIMDLYEELVRARENKNSEYRMKMLEMERKKDFDRRIQDLRSKIQEDELKIQEWRYNLDGLGNKYKSQMTSLDAELERHKEIIRGLFDDMCKYAMSSWNESLEIGIFGQLIENEESRVGSYSRKKEVTVRKSVSERLSTSLTGRQEATRESFGVFNARKDSGYLSPRSKTPDNILETRTFSSNDRDSGLVNRRSAFFDNLQSKIEDEEEVFQSIPRRYTTLEDVRLSSKASQYQG